MMGDINAIFQSYAEAIEQETAIRENITLAVKNVEKTAYMATTVLEKVHHSQGFRQIDTVCKECNAILKQLPEQYKFLHEKIPPGEFYHYHYQFRSATQKLVFVTAFLIFLQDNRLGLYPEIASRLGLTTEKDGGFLLDLEDYLLGCLFLGSELARLSVNSVSSGDYNKPFQISQFIRELHSSYSLLNPKGELRKRFDELKYSLKKAEEVVYNLTLRGLKPQESEDTSG